MQYDPTANLRPVEWVFHGGRDGSQQALVRKFEFGDKNRPELWYRVVTWEPTSERRKLIGWCRTIDKAAQLAFDYAAAMESWSHARTSHPLDDPAWRVPPEPLDLVRAYREASRAR